MTAQWDPADSLLSPECRWIGNHSAPVEPWDSHAWKRASLLFTITMIAVGFVGSVAWELLDRRHR